MMSPKPGEQGSLRPLARQEGLVVEELDGELLIYDLDRDKAHCLNGAAAIVWRHCDGASTIEDLGVAVAPDEDEAYRQELVRNALAQLSRRRLLTERFVDPDGISRRELMRKAALVGAIGLSIPVVKSIVAPTAAQASTCYPSGTLCSTGAECCPPGICNNGVCV